jgi:hypothetical protein
VLSFHKCTRWRGLKPFYLWATKVIEKLVSYKNAIIKHKKSVLPLKCVTTQWTTYQELGGKPELSCLLDVQPMCISVWDKVRIKLSPH